jgi:hypothetical protein
LGCQSFGVCGGRQSWLVEHYFEKSLGSGFHRKLGKHLLRKLIANAATRSANLDPFSPVKTPALAVGATSNADRLAGSNSTIACVVASAIFAELGLWHRCRVNRSYRWSVHRFCFFVVGLT